MVTDSYSLSTTLPTPAVGWITRQLNDARRATSGEPRPATELCGTAAEFMGMLSEDDEE